jgi:ribosomal protein S18 acetylase RimI-like enzyme
MIDIEYRAALAADSRDIARFICMAGGGLYEFLFDDLVPFLTAVDILSMGIAREDYPISFRNCLVAIDRARGELVGAANVFPADNLKEHGYGLLPTERQNHVRSLLELQDWGSMFLNALAVSNKCRGLGVGGRLLDWAEGRAKAGGFDRLSLHVWANNLSAVKFYKRRGFVELGMAPLASHPRLAGTGGSILMRKVIAVAGNQR